ncbi:MAG: ABC transporter ATP-binding protein [Myxococcales bacterium]|nr:ABC transporter ATP-binding protein [Myxococcales bacterium]
MIHARNLKKSVPSGETRVPIVRGVDLDIAEGSFAVLLGPSGCGKTTLLHVLGALDTADEGELRVAGVQLAPADPRALLHFRRHIVSVVFQFYNLLPTLSAQENIELVLEPLGLSSEQRHARARELLSRVGLSSAADQFPGQLSGGEQQRVAIARALAKRPRLVLADEPTGSLDRQNSRQILALLRSINAEQGTTFLIVTHEPELAAQASLVLHMEDGRLVDSPSEAAHDPSMQAQPATQPTPPTEAS